MIYQPLWILPALLSLFSDFKDNYDPKYSCGLSAYIVTEYIFNQYLRENDDFNNELFYNIAKQLKENFNYIDDEWAFYTSSSVHYMLLNGITDNFLFNNEYYLDRQYNYLIKNDLRISPIPYKSNDNKYAATCIYLCVNPYSKNLKETLKFVSSLSKYLIQLNNTMMFSNRELYPESHGFDDLYDILSNSEIIFSIPDEILLDEYDRYVLDEIDIENFANEVDRKVKTYLGE